MTLPDTDVASLVLDLIDSEWNTTAVDKPDVIRLKTEDESGNPVRNADPQVSEYFHFSETNTREESYRGLSRRSIDFDYAVFAEFATAGGRQRREEVYNETTRIVRENNRRFRAEQVLGNDLGTWDTLDYDATVIDDTVFDMHVIEWTFRLSAKSRTY